uniref:Uncharacterized protein n=1 Tax=Dicentrarchus labrax TaxID=13489 RepID=A0A8C4F3N6_DICLA
TSKFLVVDSLLSSLKQKQQCLSLCSALFCCLEFLMPLTPCLLPSSGRRRPGSAPRLCSLLLAPVCLPELSGPVSPCRSRYEAGPVMSTLGLPQPEMFNCTRFPRGTELCIPATGEHEVRTAEEVRGCLTKYLKWLLLQSFLFVAAFKMRLGSVSTVGGDRQLVPTARSRILRWAGGGAERAEGIGGAMAHSALWLQEGGTCTCPGLDYEGNRAQGEWYLALAQAEEGRLVLTRLVRWTRRDKELKKFIRALLKQSCPEL